MTQVFIDNVEIKRVDPDKFNQERYNLTKSGRLASGKMTMDLIAKKRKLNIEYEVLSGREFQHILDLIDGDKMFFDVSWIDHAGKHTMVCYAGAIPNTHFRIDSGWYYKGIKFSLIEQ